MNAGAPPLAGDANEEVSALIETLHKTEQRLETLTAGEVDTVADREGRTVLLRHAQEYLRHSEAARQAAVLNALPANIALLDTQGFIISVNEAWRQFAVANVLHSPGHAVGANYLWICDNARGDCADEAPQVAAGIRAVLNGTTKRFSLEYPCDSATEQRWFLLTVTPSNESHASGAVVMHLNITERIRAEQALHRHQNELRALFDVVPAMLWLKDTQNRIVRVNQKVAEAVGKSIEEIEGRPSLEIYPQDAAKYYADDLEVMRSGKPKLAIVETLRDPDGNVLWVQTDKVPVCDKDGNIVGIVVMAQNISERKEAEGRIAYLNRVYAILSGINTLIVRVHDRDELFREACRIACEEGGFLMAWIGVRDRTNMRIVPVASAGEIEDLLKAIKQRLAAGPNESPGNSLVEQIIRDKKAVVSNDVQNDPRLAFKQELAKRGCRSMAIFPLLDANDVVGVLALYSGEPDFFHDEELKLLTELAGDIAFAIDSIENERKIARLSRVQAVMSGINSAIVHIYDRQELFNEACRIAVEYGRFGTAWIGTFDAAALKVTPVAWAGQGADHLAQTRHTWRTDVVNGTGVVSRAIREKRPVFDNDITAGAGLDSPRRTEAVREGFHSLIAVPFMIMGAVVGHLSLYAKEAEFFNTDELKLLDEVAANISFAIENIGRQQKLEKLARIRAVSSEINAAIVRINDREALLRETCRIAVEHGKFELVWIVLVDNEKQSLNAVAWAGFSEAVAQGPDWPSVVTSQGSIGEAMRTKTLSFYNDIDAGSQLDGRLRKEALQKGCRSMVCLPLVVEGNLVALVALYATGIGFFDDEELALLNEVAADISFALNHIDKKERLDFLAYYDVLTGLANRSLFLERLAQNMRSAVTGGHKLAVFLFDIERFKNINDSLGQPVGDALLKQVAQWLTRNAGDASLVAHIGADHFALVMPVVKNDGNLAQLVEKTLAAFVEHPFSLNDAVFRVAAKIGVALYPHDGVDAETLFKNAEAALKKAKAGGDRYLFYTQNMTAAVAAKVTLENQLRVALENEEFVLHYQPKISLMSGKLTSAEALIRWNDPRTGLVPPGRFIPILEETGLINEVGRWALRKTIEDYLRWRNAGLPVVRMAVNVSPLQLRNSGFIEEIRQVLAVDPEAAAGLELEITESLIMEDVKHSIASLEAIHAMGVTVAIDDFGTGFSSLSYLAKLPVDTLKIDRSFVIEMTAAPEGLSLVSTIISLAHALKLKVVAEGVETEEQQRLLRLLSCDEMQGYLFSKPLPGEVFEADILRRQAK